MKYAFLGLGNMAQAIVDGMTKSGVFASDEFFGFDLDAEKCSRFENIYQMKTLSSANEAAKTADILVLAVKPKALEGLLKGIREDLKPDQLLITIAAGKSLNFYEALLGDQAHVVRVMPNVNAAVLCASSAVCGNPRCTEAEIVLAERMFSALGLCFRIEEGMFSAFSALSGAAPAFAFLFADALASSGVKAGFSRAMADQIAGQMLKGSAELILSSREHPASLIDKVTSPGGTTIEGVHALKRLGFESALQEAILAVMEKDRKLGS